YVVRLLGDGFFGKDIEIPSTTVTYTLQSADGSAEGREQKYVLPALPMRVTSLVPKNASDIRDASRDTFGGIERRQFRATEESVAAGILFGFAGVLVLIAVVRAFGRYRERAPVAVHSASQSTVLSGCLGEIARVKSNVSEHGWSPEAAGRALSAF